MQKRIVMLAITALLALGIASARAEGPVDLKNAAEKMGWLLGTQAYTFKDGTFVEAVAKAQALGLKYIEMFPGQTFSKEEGFKIGDGATPEQREKIKKVLADAGIKAISIGVGAYSENVFKFAKEMGLMFIDCEPKDDEATAKELAALTEKYGVKIAIHNHPGPKAHYWQPETVLNFIKKSGDSPNIGSCTDTGHFVRSGLEPLASIAELKGHTFFFHFKDLNVKFSDPKEIRDKGHDVPWGSGENNVYGLMAMLKGWGWKGGLMAEYEYWTPEQFDSLKQSYEYVNMVAAALDDEGWTPVFKDDLSNAQVTPGSWTFKDGVLEAQPKGHNINTQEQFGDFILSLEYKCAEKTNSGVFLRMGDIKDWLNTAIEIQILQTPEKNKTHNTGAIYDVKGVEGNNVKPVGEWNQMTIIARKNMLYVANNSAQVVSINLDQWTQAGKNPDGTANKFKKVAYKDMPRKGFLSFQYHNTPIAFRNIKVKTIE